MNNRMLIIGEQNGAASPGVTLPVTQNVIRTQVTRLGVKRLIRAQGAESLILPVDARTAGKENDREAVVAAEEQWLFLQLDIIKGVHTAQNVGCYQVKRSRDSERAEIDGQRRSCCQTSHSDDDGDVMFAPRRRR